MSPTYREALKRADRDDDGDFTIYLSINEMPSVDLYRRFADAGVFDFVYPPWMGAVRPGHAGRSGAHAPPRPRCTVSPTTSSPSSNPEVPREDHEARPAARLLGLGPAPRTGSTSSKKPTASASTPVWTAESYGSDALTPLAWWGSRTTKVRLGTSLCQLSARTPTAMAMAAQTMDHLSGGRFVLGLGVSGPQVVEGWYGQPFPAPLARTREYVGIVRQVLARQEPVTNDGPHYPLPYPGGTGLGKPLKSIVHPLRADIPIILGAEGPKNVALAAEIADGWFPIFFSPRAMSSFEASLDEGFARPGARRSAGRLRGPRLRADRHCRRHRGGGRRLPPLFGLLHRRHGGQGDELPLRRLRPHGLRGGRPQNTGAYLDGRKDDTAAAVPTSMVEDVALIGPVEKITGTTSRAWRSSRATTMLINGDVATLRTMAELVLG